MRRALGVRPVLAALLCAAFIPSPAARACGPVATDGVWEEQHPLAAAAHGAVIDPVFDRMVVLREQPQANGLGRMSLWSLPLHGAPTWRRDDIATPAALNTGNSFHNAVYDPKRHRVLTVVMTDDLTRMSVWALPLRAPYAWEEVVTTGTPPGLRFEAGLVLDAARDRLVLFGGMDIRTFRTLNDTWSLSLTGTPEWTPISPTGPLAPGASQPTMVLDAASDRVVVVCTLDPFLSGQQQTWALSLGAAPAWTRLDADGDPLAPTYGFSELALDPPHARVLAFDLSEGRVVAMPLVGGPWTEAGAITVPHGHAASVVHDAPRGRFLLHGGYEGSAYVKLADTHVFTTASGWTSLVPHAPEPAARYDAASEMDHSRARLLVHGGMSSGGAALGDTWALSLADLSWSQVVTQGEAPFRAGQQAVLDPIQDRLLVVGGTPGFSQPDSMDVWQLSLATEPPMWMKLHPLGTPPSPRSGVALAFDLPRNRLVMYGGGSDELWALELTGTPTWHPIVSAAGPRPGVLSTAVMAADPLRARLIMFGGVDGSGSCHDETWALENGWLEDRWVRIGEGLPAPGGRQLSTMVYDPLLDRLLVHGGYGYQMEGGFPHLLDLNDTWELPLSTPGGWRMLDSGGDVPLRRERHVMGFDGLHDRLVVTTGTTSGSRDVWALSFSPPVDAVPTPPAPAPPSTLALAPLRNPCAGALDVRLASPARGRVSLEVLDVSGRRVRALDLGEREAGRHDVRLLEPGATAPGLYLVRARQESHVATTKVLITQ